MPICTIERPRCIYKMIFNKTRFLHLCRRTAYWTSEGATAMPSRIFPKSNSLTDAVQFIKRRSKTKSILLSLWKKNGLRIWLFFIPMQIHASLHSSRPYGVRLNQTGLTVGFVVTWLGYAHFRSAFSILCFALEKRNVYRNLQIQVHSRSILRIRNCESKLFSSKYHKVAYVSIFSWWYANNWVNLIPPEGVGPTSKNVRPPLGRSVTCLRVGKVAPPKCLSSDKYFLKF